MKVDKKNLRRADLVTTIILMILSLASLAISIKMLLHTIVSYMPWYKSAGLFPLIVSSFLFLCSLLLFLRARKEGAKFDFFTTEKFNNMLKSREFKVALTVIGLLAAYIFILLNILPYWIATFIYIFSFIFIFKEKTVKGIIMTVVVSAISTAVLTYGFGQLAMIPLP